MVGEGSEKFGEETEEERRSDRVGESGDEPVGRGNQVRYHSKKSGRQATGFSSKRPASCYLLPSVEMARPSESSRAESS